jgi:NAD(P)H dehydrogenase (quinone)
MKGALVGKPGGTITSVGTQGGGQIPFMAHQGIVFVPLGYTDEVHGASPYGCGTFAGPDGSRQPTDLEKEIAETHGKHFATTTAKLAAK